MTAGSASSLLVGELELSPVVILDARSATLADAAVAVCQSRVHAVLLNDGSILTDSDVTRAIARGRGPDDPARVAATPDPLAIPARAPVGEALAAMLRHHVRLLVVLDAEVRPIGFLGLLDATRAVVGGGESPSWLAGLRLALRVERRD